MTGSIQLSMRMQAIADMVRAEGRVVDVGCDHGYIPIWLVEQRKCSGAVAADINRGPLARARENIRRHGLSGYIETRLSDGLSAFKPGEGESLVIAGMGGPLVERILSDGRRTAMSFQEIILEPQSEIGHVRSFLQKEGYRIEEENMVLEEGKFYPVLRVVRGQMEPLTEAEQEFGPCLLRSKNAVLRQFLIREREAAERLYGKLSEAQSEKAARRGAEIRIKLRMISTALEYYEGNQNSAEQRG